MACNGPKPKVGKSKYHCCVPKCTSDDQKKNENVSFHPVTDLRKKLWLQKRRRDEGACFRVINSYSWFAYSLNII